MTHDEVTKGLEWILGHRELLLQNRDTLNAALALLRVPAVAEVEAAKVSIRCNAHGVNWHDDCPFCQRCRLYLRALDALAREPHLDARIAQDIASIAALEARLVDAGAVHLADEQSVRNMEAKLARVREVTAEYERIVSIPSMIITDESMRTLRAVAMRLRAALADEATP